MIKQGMIGLWQAHSDLWNWTEGDTDKGVALLIFMALDLFVLVSVVITGFIICS